MTAVLGLILMLAGTFLLVASIVALIRPIPKLFMPTRKRAGAGLLIALVVGTTGGALSPDQQPAVAATAAPNEEAVPEKRTPAKERPVERKSDELKEQLIASWKSLRAATSDCDETNKRLGDAIGAVSSGGGSIYDAYALARDGVETCRSAWSALGELGPPPAADASLRSDFSTTLESCRGAYLMRQESLETATKILDGDFRPSLVSTYKDQAGVAQQGVMACAAGYMSAALKAGVDPKKMES
jgi:hypothetical protein